ncbi:McrC family protein [Flavobacterium sp.]|uniref:McrC family protein n=1 Tax=Flavobacterium sp. TaxID=239 RepID=UPI00374FE9AC
MSKENFIQVFEYQKLRYDGTNAFKKNHFDAMVLFNEKNQNKYYTIIHKGVLFNSYVGVIQIGGLTIEILPKADKSDSPDKKTWQGVLLNMLRVCKHITIDNVSETNLKKRHNSILDVYFEMYLSEIENLVKRGLIKKYRRVQSNQLALKGKLVFSQNIQKNSVHKERFYCEHQVYDKDHLLHQILLKGLKILENLVDVTIKDKLNRLLFEFNDYKDVAVNSSHFDKIISNRKNIPYYKALNIAKMIILNYSPNLNSGSDNMLTLLFDMNKLWEEYIYRILQNNKPIGFKVNFQNKTHFWETKTIRPDIVITSDDGQTFVIDTKWKIIDTNKPSDDDLKQMFTYCLHWEAEKSMLLYPMINQTDSKFGVYHYNGLNRKCKLGFVSVLQNGQLIKSVELSKEIFKKFDVL